MSSVNTQAAQALRTMFARSATLQGEAGGSESSAATHVYFGATPKLDDQAAFPRPLIIIGLTEDFRYHQIAGGERNQMRPEGSLTFFGIRNTPASFIHGEDCDYSAAEINHMDFFGAVLDDVAGIAGWDDNLSVTDIHLKDFAEVDAKFWSQLGRFYFAGGVINWGDQSRWRTR